jgi:hypothetical protein
MLDPYALSGEALPPESHSRPSTSATYLESTPGPFVLELLAQVEQVKGTTVFSFATPVGDKLGDVLASEGQVCLVRLSTGQITLGERLAARNPATAAAVRRALLRVKAEGRPLGDVLLALGAVESAQIREAMLEQIADGLAVIAAAAPAGLLRSTAPGSTRRLASTLSVFAPSDIYWRAVAQLAPASSDAVTRCYHTIGPTGATALLAIRGEEPLPIASLGLADWSLGEIVRLVRGIAAMAAPPALLAAEIVPRLLMISSSLGALLVVADASRVAAIGFLDAGARARALGEARQIMCTDA